MKENNIYQIKTSTLDKIIKYIEESEESFDIDWGSGRDLELLIKDNKMPDIYYELLKIRYGKIEATESDCKCSYVEINNGQKFKVSHNGCESHSMFPFHDKVFKKNTK